MLLIVGTIRLPPERMTDAIGAMQCMIMASRAEPGCLHYSYAADLLDPGLIHVKEMWVDHGALTQHFESPHIAAWRAEWPALGIKDRNLMLYTVSDVRPI